MTQLEALQQLIDKHYGKQDAGDTPENLGQCVGLIEEYTDLLGLPHTWGNAKDLLNDADLSKFTVVDNDPNNTSQYPPVGAIFVYDSTWGGGDGHTGLVVASSGRAFIGFEQNNPANCRFVVHSYDHLLGWMIPAIIAQSTTQTASSNNTTINEVTTLNDNTTYDFGGTIGKQTLGAIRSQLEDAIRDRDSAKSKVTEQQTTIEDQEIEITKLNTQVNTLDSQIETLTNRLKAQGTEISVPSNTPTLPPTPQYTFAPWVPEWLKGLLGE